jgi:hypothetical protein
MYVLCQLNTSTLPRLEQLLLDVPFVSRGDTSTSAPVIIPSAPLLREAKAIDVPYLQADPRNPFERLTTLNIKGTGMPTLVAFLRCCLNLLDLSASNNIRTGDPEPPHLELRSLRSLKIHFGDILSLRVDASDAIQRRFTKRFRSDSGVRFRSEAWDKRFWS